MLCHITSIVSLHPLLHLQGACQPQSLFESKQHTYETSGSSLVCNFKITLASIVKMIVVGFLLPDLMA